MSDGTTLDEELYRRAEALLEPGDIELEGAVVHTDVGGDEEPELHQATLELGDIIAEHATDDDTYVYSGNDDSDFGVNQHQGLTLDEDAFVWECQQLLREEAFDIVFYWEATADQEAILAAMRDADYEVVGVPIED
jgi:hypothetical protein